MMHARSAVKTLAATTCQRDSERGYLWMQQSIIHVHVQLPVCSRILVPAFSCSCSRSRNPCQRQRSQQSSLSRRRSWRQRNSSWPSKSRGERDAKRFDEKTKRVSAAPACMCLWTMQSNCSRRQGLPIQRRQRAQRNTCLGDLCAKGHRCCRCCCSFTH